MKRNLLYLLSLLLFIVEVNAQQGLINRGNLQVHSGGNLSIGMNFTNSSSASLVNNGSVYASATISNDQAAMVAGTGTLYISGTGAQSLNGTAVFRTYNLVTNNTSGITLNNNLSVAGLHTFSNGLIATSATPNYLVYENGSSHSGSNDSRHVTGWVKKIGNTPFIFPVGNTNYLRPIEISGLSASSEFNCHYYPSTQNIYNLMSPLVKVKANEYWILDKISGGSAVMTMNWDNSKVAMDNVILSDVVTGRFNGTNWADAGGTPAGDVSTTGSVISGTQSLFGPVTIAYKSFPIPLKLLSFTGWRRTGITYLHWVTENEMDVDRFEVERSFNGTGFTVIGSVNARNNGLRELYSLNDPSSFTGIAYYRLRSFDRDGTFSYSKWIMVSEIAHDRSTFLVSNPAKTAITIFNRSATAGNYNYNLYNTSGQPVLSGKINLASNAAGMIRLPLQIAHGIYILELVNDRTRFTQQVLIER